MSRSICWLYCAAVCVAAPAGAQVFEEVSRSAGVRHYCYGPLHQICGGVAVFDYNNDGYEDIYLTGGLEPDRLYENNGNGTFRDVTKDAGLGFLKDTPTVGVATGDIDNDGHREIFVTTEEGHRAFLLRNNGDGTFTDITETAGITGEQWSTSVTFGDYNLDGFLDIYVSSYVVYDSLPYDEHLAGAIENHLYRNNGDLTFDDVAHSLGVNDYEGATLAVAFTDYDGDNNVDLFVANDFGYLFSPSALYRNDSGTAFADVGKVSAMDSAINAMGIAVGDYDEDGDLDYYVTNMAGNLFHENVGNGRFVELGMAKEIGNPFSTGWGTAFLDYDNDTYLDLLVSNGRVLPRYSLDLVDHRNRLILPHENKLFRNIGNGEFLDVSRVEGVADSTKGRGLAYVDYDNDGDLDFVVAVVRQDRGEVGHTLVYRNDTENGHHWLKLKLEGTVSNRDAFGCKVRVVAGGRSWIREVGGGSSYLSQNSSVVHFGLGAYSAVDSVIVTWPGGATYVRTDVPSNQLLHIVEAADHANDGQQ